MSNPELEELRSNLQKSRALTDIELKKSGLTRRQLLNKSSCFILLGIVIVALGVGFILRTQAVDKPLHEKTPLLEIPLAIIALIASFALCKKGMDVWPVKIGVALVGVAIPFSDLMLQ